MAIDALSVLSPALSLNEYDNDGGMSFLDELSEAQPDTEHATMPHSLEGLEELSSWYLRSVSRKSGLLGKEDELALAKRISQGDESAKRTLAQANLRLVINIAKRYAGRGASFMDLVQEGNLGLMKAIEKFNYRLGYRFSTYATWWIKQSVFQAFAEHDRPIRLPGHVLDSVIKFRKARYALKERWGRPATDEELAQQMGVSVKKVHQLTRSSQRMMSLESEIVMKDGNSQTLGETIEDDTLPEPDAALCQNTALRQLRLALLHHLDDRERDIVFRRFGMITTSHPEEIVTKDKMTLEEIGKLYGVTRECVRQTELRAIRKLRTSTFIQQLID